MKIGFTGTRDGMTDYQKAWFAYHFMSQPLDMFGFNEFHHGDCVGADADAVSIVQAIKQTIPIKVHSHPANMPEFRAETSADVIHGIMPPMDRNLEIARASDILFACPKTPQEMNYSGTWSTVRRARMVGIPVLIICEGVPLLKLKVENLE